MTDIIKVKTKSNYPPAIMQISTERISEEGSVFEKGTYGSEKSFPCSREVVVKIIDKIKKL